MAAAITLALVPATVLTGSAPVRAAVGAGFEIDAADLRFIRTQIRVAEAHVASGAPYACSSLLGSGPAQVPSPVLPYGLRSVDGRCNNLQPGQSNFGRADERFPRLLVPTFGPAQPDPGLFGGPGGPTTSYAQTSGFVFDGQPRLVSNLVVDQTSTNPAAVAAAGPGCASQSPGDTCFIGNVAPDEGLSAPYNSVFTFFGQFFDHGLDLVPKGGSGTVVMPLTDEDPLAGQAPLDAMMMNRATNQPGPDGVLGTGDDVREAINLTTPFVDQNQTYTSHPSHQVFLRAYTGTPPVPTGKLLDGAQGHIANWAEVKQQAATVLGIALTDTDVLNVPKVLTDPYGHFVPGPAGFPQVELAAGGLREGNPSSPVSVADAARTGHAFLDDIAHNAAPGGGKVADGDTAISTASQLQPAGTYDDELLDEHFVTGDGRGNENIGLTAIHTVFHSEHNRIADEIGRPGGLIDTLLTPAEIADWRANDAGSGWSYGERLFQAARFVTEMQYQHLVFEEFARKVQPQVNVFAGYDSSVDPAIAAEFAHTVYRFGHSMLNESVARVAADEVTDRSMPLFDAFLNPTAFDAGGLDAGRAVGEVVRGSVMQRGNELDEFVTDVLRNRLVGLPLDLAAINVARGRSEGIPPLNGARRQLFAKTGGSELAPYTSWADLSVNLKHRETLFNLVAAYGTHPSVTTLDPDGAGPVTAGSMAARRAAAEQLILLSTLPGPDGQPGGGDDIPAPADALDFMVGSGAWVNGPGGVTTTGVDAIDFWVGGLAEAQAPFGGLLGSTFNYVFETQLERLQDGDRFYYLHRLVGTNLLVQLEGNSLAELIMRNSDVDNLPADVFTRPDYVFKVKNLGSSGAIVDDPTTPDWNENQLLTRNVPTTGTIRFAGAEHVVFNGANVDNGVSMHDRLYSGAGDDTVRGNGGNDVAEGGSGNDNLIGGAGNDILNDVFGDDVIKGGPGDDAISSGGGFDLNQGGPGDDFVVGGSDPTETFGGAGDDVIFAGGSSDTAFGGNGADWIEGGGQADLLQGDNGFPFQNDPTGGHDVIIGDGGNDDYDAEGGDDVMVAGPGIERNEGMLGFDWVTHRGDPQAADADMQRTGLLPPDVNDIRDRYDLVEGLSGWNFSDVLRGDDGDAATMVGHELNAAGIGRIAGLSALLPAGATSFTGGNVILGGGGSDVIEGRGGNDLIDGDSWLDVKLSDGNQLFDSLTAVRARVFAGTLSPGSLDIVRRIVTTGVQASDVDTVQYSGPQANYTLTFNANGTVTVNDVVGADGTDTVRNVEQIQFCLVPGAAAGTCDQFGPAQRLALNRPPAGAVTLTTLTPTENVALTASTAGITDADGLPAAFAFRWQASAIGGAAPFTDIVGATSATLLPAAAQINRRLRVLVTYVDLGGTTETVTSAATIVTGDQFVGGAAADTFTGTAGRDDATGNGGADTFTLAGGPDVASGGGANDAISGGAGDDTLDGDGGDDTLNGGADQDVLNGGAGNDTMNGDGGADVLLGGAGNDTMNGGAGEDVFRYTAAFGADTVSGFDADAAGGQDRVDLSGVGVRAANFATRVTIAAQAGGRTLVTVRNSAGTVLGTISLNGGPANYTIADFVLAP